MRRRFAMCCCSRICGRNLDPARADRRLRFGRRRTDGVARATARAAVRGFHLPGRHRAPAVRHQERRDGGALFGAMRRGAAGARHPLPGGRVQHRVGLRAGCPAGSAPRIAGHRRHRAWRGGGGRGLHIATHRGHRHGGDHRRRRLHGCHSSLERARASHRDRLFCICRAGRGRLDGRTDRRGRRPALSRSAVQD